MAWSPGGRRANELFVVVTREAAIRLRKAFLNKP
jgi:hypothetical protein